jgi:predicted AAA+ superfamily ATPase
MRGLDLGAAAIGTTEFASATKTGLTRFAWGAKMVDVLIERRLTRPLRELAWANDKMAFVSGPRQAGKTTFARQQLKERASGRYGNWDDIEFRRAWTKSPKALLPPGVPPGSLERPLVVFDEVHKAKGWKRTLKGLYDTLEAPCDILVTGSARLDVYRRGGESLLGRYLRFRLHPFSLGELAGRGLASPAAAAEAVAHPTRAEPAARETLELLSEYGGFPEPFLRQSARFARLWRRGRAEKIVREDLRDLSRIPELSQVEMLMALLPERAASPLSRQSLREDLEVAYDTVTRWLRYLEQLYYIFELKPFARSVPRSLRKEGKLYLWDWSEVEASGPRFENLVASHLLKAADVWSDTGEGVFELHYLRNKDRAEIDFLLTRNRKPWLAVECKLSDDEPNPSFRAFLPHLGWPPFVQLVMRAGVSRRLSVEGRHGLVVSAERFLVSLP